MQSHRFRPESTFSYSLARAKSDEGDYLATLADIDSTTLEQGNASILASKPGSILARGEAGIHNPKGEIMSRMDVWSTIHDDLPPLKTAIGSYFRDVLVQRAEPERGSDPS
jgi:hypothetical protein